MSERRPLLLIDVDGPLNPYAAKPTQRPEGYTTHRMMTDSWRARGARKPLRVWLNPGHGPALTALPYELAWCTTWLDEANEWIGPHLGLPVLPVVPFQELWSPRSDGTFWKTWDVVRWAEGRPFAWIDDEITDTDREYVAGVHQGPALLLTISPRTGLLPEHFEQLADWATNLAAAEAA